MKQQVAVIGEGVIDRFLVDGQARDVIGGSPLNTAVAIKRAGIDVHWWARVSSSAEGRAIWDYAERNEVIKQGAVTIDRPAPIVTIALDEAGIPTYDFALDGAADWEWQESDFQNLTEYGAVQIGSLTTVLEPGATALLQALKSMKLIANPPLISYDPNARPRAAKNETDAERMRARIQELVKLADLVKVSDEDLGWFDATRTPADIAAEWSQLGPQLVVMTRGSEGATAYRAGFKIAQTPGIKVEVVDTVGAGDTFMAWLLAAVLKAGDIPATEQDVASAIERAAKAAAITCSRAGCNPPTTLEL